MRAAVVLALVLALTACRRDEAVKSSGPENTPPVSTTGVVPPEKGPAPPRVTQEVHLIEYQINMPAVLPSAGAIGFKVENGGKEDHGFVIQGNGLEAQSAVLKPGDTQEVGVVLTPGTYTVWCPVKDHAQKGMKATITVR